MDYNVVLSSEVKDALAAGKPVIALESTIICHGMPYPDNVKTALACKRIAERNGAVAAVCAIIKGVMHAGLTEEQIEQLGKAGTEVKKVSRRDIPAVIARGEDGATTVAGTMFIARRAGIKVFATGGIGGVHRGAEDSMDISADLNELGRTPVAVVCAGPKSVLDIGRTLEYLETQGVPVVAFGTDRVPAFYTPDSGFRAPVRADSVEELAGMVQAMDALDMQSGMVIMNPIPDKYAPDGEKIEKATSKAVKEAEKLNLDGRDVTPFLLKRISELTDNESLEANIALVYNNVRLASLIAAKAVQGTQNSKSCNDKIEK